MRITEFKELALSFPGTEEGPHFERLAYKVTGKRIFASLHESTAMANLKLTPKEQELFCKYDKSAIYPVPNKFGLQGWTTFELDKIPRELMLDALETAYKGVFRK
ncbi:MAG TPA: MmcQ/YjbR family DNA-binding protein [Cyclobacteriaceae bacterium]|nr:MmcQ/YjbR family DNA-binding protein [Cyclobacteriaceae bacterium]